MKEFRNALTEFLTPEIREVTYGFKCDACGATAYQQKTLEIGLFRSRVINEDPITLVRPGALNCEHNLINIGQI